MCYDLVQWLVDIDNEYLDNRIFEFETCHWNKDLRYIIISTSTIEFKPGRDTFQCMVIE